MFSSSHRRQGRRLVRFALGGFGGISLVAGVRCSFRDKDAGSFRSGAYGCDRGRRPGASSAAGGTVAISPNPPTGGSRMVSTTSKSEPWSGRARAARRCPARVGRAGDVPGRAVVGEDHAVALQRRPARPRLRREAARVDSSPSAGPRRPIGGRLGSVESLAPSDAPARRRRFACRCAVKRSAWSIAPARDLVVAGEPGQDRQAGGVGARPAAGRSVFERRFQIAPDPAVQPAPLASSADSS